MQDETGQTVRFEKIRSAFLGFVPDWVLSRAEAQVLAFMREACDARGRLDALAETHAEHPRQESPGPVDRDAGASGGVGVSEHVEETVRCAHCGLLGPQLQAYESEHHPPVWLHTHCFDAWLLSRRLRQKSGGDSLRERIRRGMAREGEG